MRQDELEINVESLNGSTWLFREYSDPQQLAQEKLYWDWVKRFFPTLILERRTVYKIENDEKILIGSCWQKLHSGKETVLQTDVARLVEFDVPLAFAILFFLDQSYSQINSYWIDLVDYYKIDRFDFSKSRDEALPGNLDEKFINAYWLELLNIALMSNQDWPAIFSEKQIQLRQYLLKSVVLEKLYPLPLSQLRLSIEFFCRHFNAFHSESFIECQNQIIKNYHLFFPDIFQEKMKKITEEFLSHLKMAVVDDTLCNMDEHAFHIAMIKSCIGKLYLKTQTQLLSMNQCALLLATLQHFLSVCSVHSREIAMLVNMSNGIVGVVSAAGQLRPLPIDLSILSQSDFATHCMSWLKQTETIDLKDVLLNKNLFIYIYLRSVAQFKQPTSYPRFLAAPQPVLPEGMESLYQKIILENNPDQLCILLFELMQIAPPDFWNLLLRQLMLIVFCERHTIAIVDQVRGSLDIQKVFAEVTISSDLLSQFSAHFKNALTQQITESHDSQTAGFRSSGSSAMFLRGAAPPARTADAQPAVPASSWLAYFQSFLPKSA